MANILGEHLIEASNVYKSQKHNYNSYEEFFAEHCVKHLHSNEEESLKILEDFLLNKLESIDEKTTNDEIKEMISELQRKLINKNCVSEDFDACEFIGYLLLGQLLKSK